MVEHSAVNRVVVGSSPTRGVFFFLGSMVKRLRHRPFTAVTGVQIPLESLRNLYADVAQFSRNKDCVHDGNIRRTNACINVRLMFSSYRRLHRERENEVFERHAIRFHMPMWLNWQSS